MALEHAILVSLAERPGTGYEIGQQFDRSIGYFWSATHQQIYRTLKRMTKDGWVSFAAVAQSGRPDKKVYRISQQGREVLRAWINDSNPPASDRDLALKIRAAEHGDLEKLNAEIRTTRTHHAQRLHAFEGFARDNFAAGADLTGRALHQYLVLRGGIETERSLVRWYDEVLQSLDGGPQPGPERQSHVLNALPETL